MVEFDFNDDDQRFYSPKRPESIEETLASENLKFIYCAYPLVCILTGTFILLNLRETVEIPRIS